MKQVAKKSTTSVPRKISIGSCRKNGLVPTCESPANVTLYTSSASSAEIGFGKGLDTNCGNRHKDVYLTNGLHDSCEQVLGNGSGYSDVMPNAYIKSSAGVTTVRQRTVGHSVSAISSSSSSHVSATSVPLPTLRQTSAKTENSRSLKDASAKHVSAETAKSSSNLVSTATSSNSPVDVIIVKADDDSKPDVRLVKRPVTPADEKKCEVKKARLDGALGQLVKVDGSDRLSRKEVDRWLLDFSNQYIKSHYNLDIVLMSKKIKDMQDNQMKLQKVAQEVQRKIVELSMKQSKINHPSPAISSATQVMKSPGNLLVRPQSALPTMTATLPPSIRMTQTTLAPCKLPAASANLAALQRPATDSTLQPHVATAVAGSSTSAGTEATANKSVIDLTNDEDTSAPAKKLPTQTPQVFVIARQPMTSVPALTVTSSTAVVKPMRPAAPPLLHITPSQPPQLQLPLALRHPAPLPAVPLQSSVPPGAKWPPPKPTLKLSRVANGIVLSWNMTLMSTHEQAASYHLYAYQEGSEPPSTSLWKRIGTVKALPLPMACTLTQFQLGNVYHFAVRAVDIHGQCSAFSEPGSIHLDP